MKKAVIVVGSHYAGKSKTINQFFKPLVGLSGRQRRFYLANFAGAVFSQSLEERFGYDGILFSQSLEEKGIRDVRAVVADCQHYQRLVFAARPENEAVSLYGSLKSELETQGFSVATVRVVRNQPEAFYADCAKQIIQQLN